MRLISLSLIFLLFIGCNKDEPINSQEDILFFGNFFGFCQGESCIEIYKLENGVLYEDSEDQYPSPQGNAYNWIARQDEDFQLAEPLIDDFPNQLFDEVDQVIGMPDAGDWGGVYVTLERDGTRSIWLIDYVDQNIPTYLHEYTAEIKRIVEVLK